MNAGRELDRAEDMSAAKSSKATQWRISLAERRVPAATVSRG